MTICLPLLCVRLTCFLLISLPSLLGVLIMFSGARFAPRTWLAQEG